jgi:DNA repair exonuclease SbcCD ATPase subunit/DNA repair exonuclease SbcCD nuclease subunit
MPDNIIVIPELEGKQFPFVWHAADLHVRLQSRHDEYRSCFHRVFRYLAKEKKRGKRGIVVVCGDVLHSKCELTPEAIELVLMFFEGIALIFPVICIAGNHDTNLSNSDRMDALSPILRKLKNVYYLRDSGLYRAGNIIFGVSSVFDGKLIKAPKRESGIHRVALYHGAVNGCVTDVGTRLAAERTVEDFEGWDYGMFGDIHKCQAMRMRMAFPGSLIQQNFGETGFHGILRWEMGRDQAHRINIPNSWGFCKLRVIDGELQEGVDIPLHPRIELHIESGTPEQIARIERHLRKNYEVESIEPIQVELETEKEMDVLKTLTMSSFLPLKMLSSYLERLKVPDDQVDRIGRIHHKWRKELIDKDTNGAVGRWLPTRMMFHNMFSYRGSWTLEFPTGLLGRFGMNGTGKSSTIDILLLLLFDKTVRSDSRAINAKIVTKGETDFRGMVEFTHAGAKYCVYREGKTSSRGLNVKTRFWRIGGKGIKDLTGKDRLETNRAIESIIGSYEETMNIGVMLQKSGTGFVDETPMRRKERINRILNLDKFDKICERISEAKRAVNAELKVLGNVDPNDRFEIEEQHDTVKDRIETTKVRLAKCERTLAKLGSGNFDEIDDPEDELASLTREVERYQEELSQLPKGSGDFKLLKELQAELEISKTLERSISYELQPSSIYNTVREMSEIVAQSKDASFQGATDMMIKTAEGRIWNAAIEEELENLTEDIKQCKVQVEKLKDHKYNPDCEYCCDNPFIKQAVIDKERLPQLLKQQNKCHENIQLYKINAKIEIADQRYRELLHELIAADTESNTIPLTAIREYVNRGTSMHSSVLEKLIEREQASLEGHVKRTQAESKLAEANKRQRVIKQYIELGVADVLIEKKRMAERLLQDIERYGMLKERLAELRNSAKRVLAVREQIEDLTIYGNAMSRDGIPKQLAARLVPRLEREINAVIAQVSDFRISIDPLTASMSIRDLKGSGKDQALDAQLGCGSEKLIIELSLRAVIATMSCASAPGIMMLDESLNDFDVNKRSSLDCLFRTLARHFETVVVITHQDYVKGLVDKQIMPVEKVDWQKVLKHMPVAAGQ